MEPKKSPKPPVVVGGTGVPSLPSDRRITGTINYAYPNDFPGECRGRVKLAEYEAKRKFNDAAPPAVQVAKNLREKCITCVMGPTKVFAEAAIGLGWDAGRIDERVRDFVRAAADWAGLRTASTKDIVDEIEAFPEWKEYLELLKRSQTAVKANRRTTTRIGYRTEIKAYMKSHSLKTNEEAARHFGISHDTLKSIMSGKGKPRYSQATRDSVLKKIGYKTV